MPTDNGSEDGSSSKARMGAILRSSWFILGVTVLAAAILYVLVFFHQAGCPQREVVDQAWPAPDDAPCLVAGATYTVELSLIYPQRLLNEPSAASRPLRVWLRAALLPAEREVGPWTVVFGSQGGGILFTDEAGREIAPRVVITPGIESAEPAMLYVRRSALPEAPDELSPIVRVYERSNGSPLLTVALPAIELESDAEAFWRRLGDMALGPTTPLLVLATGLVAFGVRQWQEERKEERKEEREREQRRRKDAKLAQIEALPSLHDVIQAAHKYEEYRRKIKDDPEWQDDDLHRRLEEIWGRFSVQDLQDGTVRALCNDDHKNAHMLFGLAREKGDGKNITDALGKLLEGQTTEKVQAWLVVGRYYGCRPDLDRQVHKAMACQMVQLISEGSADFPSIASQLEEYEYLEQLVDEPSLEEALGKRTTVSTPKVEREAALKLLEKRPPKDWLRLWSETPKNVWPPLAYWLDRRERRSPFGPEEAELDPCLPFYSVEGPLLRYIQARKPVALFAQAGSGRTAAALLLAHFCHRDGAFPVYYVPPANAGESPLLEMARVTAATVARYLAYNGEGFFKLARSCQFGVAHLLSLWIPLDNLEGELQRRGLKGKNPDPRLIDEIEKLYPSNPLSHTDENLLELLGDALPQGFGCFYWILDPPSDHPRESRQPFVRFLQTLLDLEARLAARNVFLKLLLPQGLQPFLRLPSKTVELEPWSPDKLEALLEQRFIGYRTLWQKTFPQPGDRDHIIAEAHGLPRHLIRSANKRFYELGLEKQQWYPDQPDYGQPYEHEQFADQEDRLREIDQYLADSERRVTFVLGDAGVGKTWFLHEVAWGLESQQKAHPLYLGLAEKWRDNLQSVRLAINAIVVEIESARDTSEPLVLLVDSVDQVPYEFTEQLEEKVLVKAVQHGPIVIAEQRGRPRRWNATELREKTHQILLEACRIPFAALQAKKKAMAMLGDAHQHLYPYLEALSILRAFDDVRMGEVLKVPFPHEPWDYIACLEMRRKLLATTMVHWEKEKRGYVIDEPLRLLLEAALRQRDEKLWRELHCVAHRLYEKWADEFEQSRGDWIEELKYHANVLEQHGDDPADCRPLPKAPEEGGEK